MVTGEQIRAARALIRWEQKDLATASGVSLETIKRLEKAHGMVGGSVKSLSQIVRAFEDKGVLFVGDSEQSMGGVGVRLKGA